MAYYNKPKRISNDSMKQTVFSNIHEGRVNPLKKYYTFVEVDGTEKLYIHECKFRSEAISHFESEARKDHGKLKGFIGVLK